MTHLSVVLVLGAWLLGCVTPRPEAPGGPPTAVERASPQAPTDSPDASIPKDRSEPEWVITDEGVGDVRVGHPLPARLLAHGAAPASRYVLGFHADAQTHEGFRLPGLSVRVFFAGGPFSKWFESPTRPDDQGTPDEAGIRRLAQQAVKMARAGARVSWIVVDDPGVRTASGIGVNSPYAEVLRAHPAIKLRPQPPTFGSDRCAAFLTPLTRVQVYFRDCTAAREGASVTRMTIFGGDAP